MTNIDDTPFISVDFMEITAKDTVLMHDPNAARMVAQDTGYHLQEYHHTQEHPFPHGPEAILEIPNGYVSIAIRDGPTEISLETTDHRPVQKQ